MKLKRVRILNFRCLEDVEISFDNVTTFIGPNGVGKSSILRALDWFFNGSSSLTLTEEDVYDKATERRIRVEVEFDHLSPDDRSALGKYAESRDSVVIWRTWDAGGDKITGKALPTRHLKRSGAWVGLWTGGTHIGASESPIPLCSFHRPPLRQPLRQP